ncbi:hypothetical protein KEM54_002380, partial [Ascosphaera aggregata]
MTPPYGAEDSPIFIETESESDEIVVVRSSRPVLTDTNQTSFRSFQSSQSQSPSSSKSTPRRSDIHRLHIQSPKRRQQTVSRSTPNLSTRTPHSDKVVKLQNRPYSCTPTSGRNALSRTPSFALLNDNDVPVLLRSWSDSSPSLSQCHPYVTSPSPSSSPLKDRPASRRRGRWSSSLHTRSLIAQNRPLQTLTSTTFHGHTLRKNDCVELIDETFLRIASIQQTNSGIILEGHRLKRFKHLGGLVSKRINELMWMVDTAVLDKDPVLPSSTSSFSSSSSSSSSSAAYAAVSKDDVMQPRTVIFTNQAYARPVLGQYRDKEDMQNRGVLFCRFKYSRVISSGGKVVEESIVSLEPDHCDDGFWSSRGDLLKQWLGEKYYKDLCSAKATQKYTFGDAFCGAGGVSRGAHQAGLQVQWGFDHDPIAMSSWRTNFPEAVGETADVSDFHTLDARSKKVDILHISPPCQTFSQAHTIATANDPHNEACIFSIERLLKDCRPRISTVEETSGLGYSHNENFLKVVIRTYVDSGFSLRWRKAVNCADYGVPQTRKRLFIIGAAPGQPLPSFPSPTHGDGPGLQPTVYIEDAIRDIPSGTGNHHPKFARVPRKPYSGRCFASTLRCSGTEAWHPSGQRPFTARELACLQTFPLNHYFTENYCVKQVGNAVPPRLAKAIYMEIIKQLRESD